MGTTIALGVSSSISVYKACEVLRGFQKNGLDVRVLMTRNASRMIAPLLFGALARSPVLVDPFEERGGSISHIELARQVALFCVAPATANVIAKFARGVADDFLSTFYLAVDSPVLIAPAMNEAMFLHVRTQANIRALKAAGVEIVEPERGYLACREEGWGRLAAPERIVEAGLRLVRRSRSLAGRRVLVTAGPTREYLDPVRFLTNRSSGKMGYAIAEAARNRGAEVTLISAPTMLAAPPGIKIMGIRTAEEMLKAVQDSVKKTDALIMAAAVADFRPVKAASNKIKRQELSELTVELEKTPDILAQVKGDFIRVGFAAESRDLIANARDKVKRKGLDFIVANNITEKDSGFGTETNRVTIIDGKGKIDELPLMPKDEVADRVLDKLRGILK